MKNTNLRSIMEELPELDPSNLNAKRLYMRDAYVGADKAAEKRANLLVDNFRQFEKYASKDTLCGEPQITHTV